MILLKSMYGMTTSGKLFADELEDWLLESGFLQYQCQISIHYKYAPTGTKNIPLSYVNDCVYRYSSDGPGKWFLDALRNIFHATLLGYEHWFISIRTSQMKDHFISVYQARYVTSVVAKYLDTDTVKTCNFL